MRARSKRSTPSSTTVRRPTRLLPLGALAAGFGLAAPAVWAQATTAATDEPPAAQATPGALKLQRVEVHGNGERQGKDAYKADQTRIGKSQQDLKDIPQSVTVITEKLIDDTNADTLRGALHRAIGVTFEAGEGGGVGDLVRIRGFSARGDIYQDGMRDTAQYNRDTFNIDRIEVLRGSASMLFGRGSTGGVVNQVNKQPFLMNQNEVALTAGTDDYYRLTGDFNLKTGESAAVRLNVMKTDADSFRNGPTTDRTGFAPTFRWGIGTSDEFSIGLYHLRYEDRPDYGFGWLDGRPVPEARDRWFGFESDYQKDSATYGTFSWLHRFGAEMGGAELRTAFRDGKFKRDLWATTARAGAGAPPISDSTTVTRGNQTRAAEDRQRLLQSDLSAKAGWFGMKHDLVTGIDLTDEATQTYTYAGTPAKPPTLFGTPGVSPALVDTRVRAPSVNFTARNLGVYAQDTVEFIPSWKALLGLRYDSFRAEYTNTDAQPVTWSREDNLPSYRAGLIWQPQANASYYASYGTSFNTTGDLYQFGVAGATQAQRQASADRSANTPPEKSRNAEIGAKWELLDNNLALRTALFRSEKFNERNTDVDTANNAFLLSGRRHTDGIELEGAGRLLPELELFAGVAYMRGNIDEAGSVNQASVGQTPGLTPRWTGNLWLAWRATQKLRLGIGADGMSSRKPADAETSPNEAPGYVKADAMVEYSWANYAVRLNLFNLFDKNYADGLYRGHTVPGVPRSAQLTLTATL
ncbi:TonB-dependent receptor [Rivibacter subsaxonicus]|uniref:Catecholate siderophore receptor n=1 Tax=Rivibacter subsaxonicus TaxID=457575 RepID=A0A4Q7VWD9_9BURK|nr:TonB-dependent siderophore receptor [Rivibacter subsaxonicus]RZU00805.1 catecholate siderophore receptor [Rivibacter subsaxonicus]